MMLESTATLLCEWGSWARRGQIIPRYMSPSTALYLRNMEQDREPEPMITEENALQVDGAVARLHKRNSEMGLVIVLVYLRRLSIRQVAGIMDRDRRSVDMLLFSACAWIDAALDNEQGIRTLKKGVAGGAPLSV